MLQSLRILVLAMMWAIVMIAFAMFFVLASADDGLVVPPLWALGAVVLAGAAVHGVVEVIGYRTSSVPPGADPEQARATSTAALQTTTLLRMALCEAVAIVTLAGAFLVEEGGFLLYVAGAVVALALAGLHGWPGERVIGRVQASLERDGGTSHLREALGLAPGLPPGPVTRL